MRTGILLLPLMIACGSGSLFRADAGHPDPGREVFTDSATWDLPVTDPGPDSGTADAADPGTGPDIVLPPDLPSELADTGEVSPSDTGVEAVPDPGNDGGCPAVACGLACAKGLALDAEGCAICACAQCNAEADCQGQIPGCHAAKCTEQRTCSCTCAGERPETYACPGGKLVPFCKCGPAGWNCPDHPEAACPGLCVPGDDHPFACPDGTSVPWCTCKEAACRPECQAVGTFAEGWYDPCSHTLTATAGCAECVPYCAGIGTETEGWFDSCTQKPIRSGPCGPTLVCPAGPFPGCQGIPCNPGQSSTFPCGDGTEVPLCSCLPGDAACVPACHEIGTPAEGWYDCQDSLVLSGPCGGCVANCEAVGSKSEGWYSSCGDLIAWADCGTPRWNCDPDPKSSCMARAVCTGEGEMLPDGGGHCCSGLGPIALVLFHESVCSPVDCACSVCTSCGDGACTSPENPCNCPQDCGDPPPSAGLGDPCGASGICASGLECVPPGPGPGVCTRACGPGPDSCGSGFACLPVDKGMERCLKVCSATTECASGLSCGSPAAALGAACFAWPPCDPIENSGCGPADQCRVVGGIAACGPAGAIAALGDCDPAADACGPGLACGAAGLCWPVCKDPGFCKKIGYESCAKKSGEGWGYCVTP